MTKQCVITTFCDIAARVSAAHGNRYAADCFCGINSDRPGFNFERFIVDFIQTAVDEKISRDLRGEK